jgi:hypothetical protein
MLGKLFGGGEGGGPQGATWINDHYGNAIQWGDGSRNYVGSTGGSNGVGSFMPGAVTGSPKSPTYNQSGSSEPAIAPTPELPTYNASGSSAPATMPGAAAPAPSGVTSVTPASTPQQPRPSTPIPGAQPPSSLGATLPPADPVPSMPGAQEPTTRSALGSRLAPQPMAAPVQTPAEPPPPPIMPGAEPQPLRRRDENGNEYPGRKPHYRIDMPHSEDPRGLRRRPAMPGATGPIVSNLIGAATPIPGTPPMFGQPPEMPEAMPARVVPQNALFKSIFGGM